MPFSSGHLARSSALMNSILRVGTWGFSVAMPASLSVGSVLPRRLLISSLSCQLRTAFVVCRLQTVGLVIMVMRRCLLMKLPYVEPG